AARRKDRRRPDSARSNLSTLFRRLCLLLLVTPWIVVLALKSLFATNGFSLSTFFFLLYSELTIMTLAGMALVNNRLQDLRAYEARREHERLLFSFARDGMLLIRVTDDPHRSAGRYSFAIQAENPTAIEFMGAIGQTQTYVGKDIEQAFPKWLRQKLQAEFTACVTQQEVRRYEVLHPDGSLAHESVAAPVIDPFKNSVTHIIVIMRDIAERIVQERKLNEALGKAEQANKSKSEFLASMSHELRTPLNAILGFSEAMAAGIGGTLTDKQKEYTNLIHQSGAHLLSIISDILDLSKIEAGKIVLQERPVTVTDIIDSCLIMVRERAAEKGLKIKTSVSPGMPLMLADALRLKQILINLLSNAIKFTDKGSVILDARFAPETGFEFIVTDTGIGMNEEGLKLALQPFGQVESAFSRHRDGTGLGLPIAQQLAALHGGTIALASSLGLGTQITVRFPAARAVAQAPLPQSALA
ncbi:MAG TPA: ATP-binding protein, partial [Rhizomicrobium sp.]|nr:ATP-binding protein [Rhizomicrobium sp.]